MEYGSERLEQILLSGEVELATSFFPYRKLLNDNEVKPEPLAVLLTDDH